MDVFFAQRLEGNRANLPQVVLEEVYDILVLIQLGHLRDHAQELPNIRFVRVAQNFLDIGSNVDCQLSNHLAVNALVLQSQIEDVLQSVEDRSSVAAIALADAATDLRHDLAVSAHETILGNQFSQTVVESREAFLLQLLQQFFHL